MHRFEYKYLKKTGKIVLPVFLFLILIVPVLSVAQKHEFGLGLGGFNYTGDINPRYSFLNYKPGGMLFYRYNSANYATSFRFGLSLGQLSGSESKSKEPVAAVRNASFKSNITEVSIMGEYNFINYRHKKQLVKFSPYLTGGLALFTTGSPTVVSNSTPENVKNGGGTGVIGVAIPFGLGLKFILSKNWNLGTEFVARKTFTDYIDGISTAQMNIAQTGTKSTGNPLDSDWYFYTGVSLSYTIIKVKCPQDPKH